MSRLCFCAQDLKKRSYRVFVSAMETICQKTVVSAVLLPGVKYSSGRESCDNMRPERSAVFSGFRSSQ